MSLDENLYLEDIPRKEPWYRNRSNDHPFRLHRKITLDKQDAPSFRTLSIFPWNVDSLKELWDGGLYTVENLVSWKAICAEYWDAVAVGSDMHLYVFFAHQKKAFHCVRLPEDSQKLIDNDVMCVTWAICQDNATPFVPVIVFSRGAVLYIYNLDVRGMSGYIRGHGGAITSLSTHLYLPHIFSSTSRDYTTRVYDLRSTAYTERKRKDDDVVQNPHWPPGKYPSLAGAAHGLRLPPWTKGGEGQGVGKCIAVLLGGRSGGHQAAVLGSAFHPHYKVIATCGMDRAVKIWPLRPLPEYGLKREDKPLFSSAMLHKARVLSISWLQDDLLLTHSAPALMRIKPNDPHNKETRLEPGELIIWRWIGLDRFFPPGQENNPSNLLRGTSADYQDSQSFKIIAIHAFPSMPSQFITPNLNLFQSAFHDPLILHLYPGADAFCMVNASHLSPRKEAPFPMSKQKMQAKDLQGNSGASLAAVAAQMHLRDEDEESDEVDWVEGPNDTSTKLEVVHPPVMGWKICLEPQGDVNKMLMNCAMGAGGRIIVGVGTKGSVWVWKYDE